MKITFIYPDLIGSANYGGIFYVGIASLSSVLKEAGYQTSLIHITQPVKRDTFLKRVEKEDADLYAFSTTTQMFDFVKEWSGWLKDKDNSRPIIVGGVHATLYPDKVIEVDSIDLCCVGEGEDAFLEVCNAISKGKDVSSIPNLWGKRKGSIFKNRPRPLISDLDRLPFPDRTIYNYKNLMEGREDMLFFMASRGCPYNCPYCCNHGLRAVYNNHPSWVRFRSVENIIREIRSVLKEHPSTKYIGFYDDILALRKDWFEKFTEYYKTHIKLPFRCNMRANYLAQEETVRMMRDAGCKRVIIGLESGNEYVRNKILKRNMPEQILIEAGRLCKKYNIELATYNMLGLPGEDFNAVLDTIKLNAKIDTDFNFASIYYPFTKTTLHDICKEKDLLTGRMVTDYVEGSALNFDTLTHIRILFIRNNLRTLVNIYRFIYRLPNRSVGRVEKLFDAILSLKILAFTIFGFSNWLFKNVRENKIMAALVNKIKRIGKRKKISSFLSNLKD
jgi:radical SAM superfamily enzyme YgiQ (UPF0313 family)